MKNEETSTSRTEHRLSPAQEHAFYDELDAILIQASDLLAMNGVWARFILSLLEELQEGRELADRVLVGSAAALKEFEENAGELAAEIRAQLDKVDAAFYVLITEVDFALFVEPGCTSSPIILAPDSHGRLHASPNESVFTMLAADAEDKGMLELLQVYTEEKNKLVSLLWHVPLCPSYILERLEDFSPELHKYREELEVFKVWQNDMVTADDEVRQAMAPYEENYRKVLGHAIRAAGLFPADMLSMPNKLAELRRRIDQIQGEILLGAQWVVAVGVNAFRTTAQRKNVDVLELQAEGFQFLARLMKKFDWRRGARFSTFALRGVKSHIRDSLATMGNAMRIPAGSGRHTELVRRALGKLASEGVVTPTANDIAKETGLSLNICRDLMQVSGPVISLASSPVDGEGERTFGEMIEDEAAEQPNESIAKEDEIAELKRVWEKLPQLARLVVGWEYGVFGMPKLTYASIAQQLGRPPSEVPEISKKAREQFQRALKQSPLAGDMFAAMFVSSLGSQDK